MNVLKQTEVSMKKFAVVIFLFALPSAIRPLIAETTIIVKYVKAQLEVEEVAAIARNYIRSHEVKQGLGKAIEKGKELSSILLKNIYYGHDSEGGIWYVDAICESGSHYTICIDEKNEDSWLRSSDKYFGGDAIQPRRVNLPKWEK